MEHGRRRHDDVLSLLHDGTTTSTPMSDELATVTVVGAWDHRHGARLGA